MVTGNLRRCGSRCQSELNRLRADQFGGASNGVANIANEQIQPKINPLFRPAHTNSPPTPVADSSTPKRTSPRGTTARPDGPRRSPNPSPPKAPPASPAAP